MLHRYLIYFKTFSRYTFLLRLLVRFEIKKKYKDSSLGILWSLLNPLLYMIVLTLVFSKLFERTIENFPVYLLTGRLLFDFFSSSTTASMNSVIQAASLIKRVYLPFNFSCSSSAHYGVYPGSRYSQYPFRADLSFATVFFLLRNGIAAGNGDRFFQGRAAFVQCLDHHADVCFGHFLSSRNYSRQIPFYS